MAQRRGTIAGWLALLVVAWLAGGVMAIRSGELVVPDRFNPWAPLRIDEAPHWLTRHKLQRLSQDPAQCMSVLATAEMRYLPVADAPERPAQPGCGWRDAVRISATSVASGPAFVLSCPAAVSLALWEKHVLQPAAQRHFGQAVTGLTQWGSFACRNVYGRSDGPRSQHATAQALDVAGFRLANGRRISVLQQWPGEGAEALFLRELHTGACGFFDAVLGPDYNAAHRDHLHLDRGPYRACR